MQEMACLFLAADQCIEFVFEGRADPRAQVAAVADAW